MKLRSKLFLLLTLICTICVSAMGYIIAGVATREYESNFIKNKVLFAKSLAAAVDGDTIDKLFSLHSINTEEFQRYFKYFTDVKELDELTDYIFMVYYNKPDKQLYYIFEAGYNEYDNVLIETNYTHIELYVGEDGKLTGEHRDGSVSENFTIRTFDAYVPASLTQENNKATLTVDGKTLLSVNIKNNTISEIVLASGKILNEDNLDGTEEITIENRNISHYIFFHKQGTPASQPGQRYIDTPIVINTTLEILLSGISSEKPIPVDGIYGDARTIYSAVRNSEGDPVALIGIDISEDTIKNFMRKINNIVLIGTLIVIFGIVIPLIIALKYLVTNQLGKIFKATNDVLNNDYTTRVDINTSDEFGDVAKAFNLMIKTLINNMESLKNENEDLSNVKEKLIDETLTDTLTGLRNRRYLADVVEKDVFNFMINRRRMLEGEEYRELSYDNSYALMMIDIDFFKKINDTYGHGTGDLVLKELSNILKSALRSDDTPTRMGGEEFLVILKQIKTDDVQRLTEKIRRKIEEHTFMTDTGGIIHCSCSIGFVAVPPFSEKPALLNFEQSVALADQALYYAKETGRNKYIGIIAEKVPPEDIEVNKITNLKYGLEQGFYKIVEKQTK